MPRKRKDVVVISRAELQTLIDGAYREGWDDGLGEGRVIQASELYAYDRRTAGAVDMSERTVERVVKAQQRKPAQTKTPPPA